MANVMSSLVEVSAIKSRADAHLSCSRLAAMYVLPSLAAVVDHSGIVIPARINCIAMHSHTPLSVGSTFTPLCIWTVALEQSYA